MSKTYKGGIPSRLRRAADKSKKGTAGSRGDEIADTSLLLYKGDGFEHQGSGKWAKDVVRVGTWIHPVTGERVDFDKDRLMKLQESTNRFLKNQNRIPFPDGHSMKSRDNMGFWPGPFVVHNDRLYGVLEATDDTARQKLSDKSMDAVSALITRNAVDSKGNRYDEVIEHVCATNYPVLEAQGAFLKLSTEDGEDVIPFVEGKPKAEDPKVQQALDRFANALVRTRRCRMGCLSKDEKLAAGFLALQGAPGATFDECVQIIRRRGGARDPEAVCAFLKRRAGEIP